MALLWPTRTSEKQHESSVRNTVVSSRLVVDLGRDKFRVDVSGVPVKELVAVVGGHRPLLLRGGDAKLAVQGQGVRHVDLRSVPGGGKGESLSKRSKL